MKRLFIISDVASATTGYGKIAHFLATEMGKLGYECHTGGFQYVGGTIKTEHGYDIWDCTSEKNMSDAIESIKPDFTVHVRDNWVFTNRYYGPPEQGKVPYNLMPAARKTGGKVIAYSPVQAKPLPRPLIEQVNEKCDYILTMSEFGKWAYVERGWPANRIDYLYHGVADYMKPLDKKECRKVFGFPEDGILLGTVGLNIDYRKNLGSSIIVLKDVLKEFPEANLCIWSEMNSGGAILEDWIDSHGVKGHVFFPKHQSKVSGVPEETMAKLFNCFDFYLHGSCAEGFGMPVLEARACGVPVVSTNDPVIREINGDYIDYAETAYWYPTLIGAQEYLVNPHSSAKLVIERLKKPDPERLKKGSEDARKNFSWSKIARDFDRILIGWGEKPKV